jgi:uncharacterized protein (DUF58 family)
LTRFPFGFFCRTVYLRDRKTLTVLPRLGRLKPGLIARQHGSFEGSRRPRPQQSHGSGDFYGVREWRVGEGRRRIHWRSSAKHGTLVVCELEQHRELEVAVLVDLWQPDRPEVADLENVELAVSFAATVVADVCRQGGSNLLMAVAAADPDCLAGPASAPLLHAAMERLALAGASSEDYLGQLLDAAKPRLGIDTDVILVTTRPVDLSENGLAAGRGDTSPPPAAGRVRVVNTSDPGLADYFQPR